MIDINNIINTAISNAVNQALQPIREHYDAHIEALRVEIEQLKQQRAVSPATGVDTTLAQDMCVAVNNNEALREALHKIARDAAVAAAEEVMDEHTSSYDHDDYDRIVNVVDDDLPSEFPDFDDFVTKEDLRDATVSFNL